MQLAIFNPEIPRNRGREAIELIRRRWQIDKMPATMEQVKAFEQWKQAVDNFMNNESTGGVI
ncbi:hypothetical protein PQI64_11360 [Shewanella bicestrii]